MDFLRMIGLFTILGLFATQVVAAHVARRALVVARVRRRR